MLGQGPAAVLDMPTEDTLFFGEFPTKDFNAHVRRTCKGYLILLNSSLPEFISQMSEVLSQGRPTNDEACFSNTRLSATARYVSALVRKYTTQSSFVYLQTVKGYDPIWTCMIGLRIALYWRRYLCSSL